MVKIINHNPEAKTYKKYTIEANSTLELPKADAKAFIRKFEGVDWIRSKKEVPDELPSRGERGPI